MTRPQANEAACKGQQRGETQPGTGRKAGLSQRPISWKTYPTNRTFRNENSLYLFFSRAMSIASFSTLQGDARVPLCSTQGALSSAQYGTAADNQAPCQDGDPAPTILIALADGFTPRDCSLLRHISLLYRRVCYYGPCVWKTSGPLSVPITILTSSFWPEKETMSMFNVGVEHVILPIDHAHVSTLQRTDTLKMHF